MSKTELETPENEDQKTCFIIMPISDHPEYPTGHFKRVYEHIIKPACEIAGFTPKRADDVKATNYIALDIVKEIINSDMAICDLSSKNPNVLYEVGIRQAFNLPVTFIKDNLTNRIFDIQGFRDVAYDENLRIDMVKIAVTNLSETLSATYGDKNGTNSLISMLGIKAATVTEKEISLDTELILNAIKALEIPQKKKITDNNKATIIQTKHVLNQQEILSLKSSEKIYLPGSGEVVVKSNNNGRLEIVHSNDMITSIDLSKNPQIMMDVGDYLFRD